jgi:hypothetical protein
MNLYKVTVINFLTELFVQHLLTYSELKSDLKSFINDKYTDDDIDSIIKKTYVRNDPFLFLITEINNEVDIPNIYNWISEQEKINYQNEKEQEDINFFNSSNLNV